MKNFIGWNPQKFSPVNLSPFTVVYEIASICKIPVDCSKFHVTRDATLYLQAKVSASDIATNYIIVCLRTVGIAIMLTYLSLTITITIAGC